MGSEFAFRVEKRLRDDSLRRRERSNTACPDSTIYNSNLLVVFVQFFIFTGDPQILPLVSLCRFMLHMKTQ
jgi:hypothetical protein